jgi:hypothetical protein
MNMKQKYDKLNPIMLSNDLAKIKHIKLLSESTVTVKNRNSATRLITLNTLIDPSIPFYQYLEIHEFTISLPSCRTTYAFPDIPIKAQISLLK